MVEIILRVYSSRALVRVLKIISEAVRCFFVLAYLCLLYNYFKAGVFCAAEFALKTGVPFVIISISRRMIDAVRPYELYGVPNPPPRKKQGSSFPSRHVFSAALISVMCFEVSIPLACVSLFLTLLLSASRVLLAVHFVRDVAVGALAGAVFGMLAILIF